MTSEVMSDKRPACVDLPTPDQASMTATSLTKEKYKSLEGPATVPGHQTSSEPLPPRSHVPVAESRMPERPHSNSNLRSNLRSADPEEKLRVVAVAYRKLQIELQSMKKQNGVLENELHVACSRIQELEQLRESNDLVDSSIAPVPPSESTNDTLRSLIAEQEQEIQKLRESLEELQTEYESTIAEHASLDIELSGINTKYSILQEESRKKSVADGREITELRDVVRRYIKSLTNVLDSFGL